MGAIIPKPERIFTYTGYIRSIKSKSWSLEVMEIVCQADEETAPIMLEVKGEIKQYLEELHETQFREARLRIHDFPTAKRELDNYIRRLRRKYPNARIVAVMGRGKSTHRIHFHAIIEGVPEDFIREKWDGGEIVRIEHLKEHVKYDGVDHGQDYTSLAVYLFEHWTPDQGKKRWTATQNLLKPEHEKPTPVLRRYNENKPPRPPKGYVFVESRATQYGFLYYKYVREIPKPKRGRPRKGDVEGDESGG